MQTGNFSRHHVHLLLNPGSSLTFPNSFPDENKIVLTRILQLCRTVNSIWLSVLHYCFYRNTAPIFKVHHCSEFTLMRYLFHFVAFFHCNFNALRFQVHFTPAHTHKTAAYEISVQCSQAVSVKQEQHVEFLLHITTTCTILNFKRNKPPKFLGNAALATSSLCCTFKTYGSTKRHKICTHI